jgi:Zn-dependent peptidase ImmA (M78 family)
MNEICEKAEGLAAKYNSEGVAPFPFENIIADQKDVQIIQSVTMQEKTSGAILLSDNAYYIFVNSSKPAVRQYFTTAHEFGHYFLHQEILAKKEAFIDGDEYLDGENVLYLKEEVSPSLIEREANNFAASLIMPQKLVTDAWNVTKNVEECARLFRVSVVAMSIRLERLKLLI